MSGRCPGPGRSGPCSLIGDEADPMSLALAADRLYRGEGRE